MNYFGTFRIDDVSMNTDVGSLERLMNIIRERLPGASFMLAVSPLVHDVAGEPGSDRERAFPRLLSAMSDHRNFYDVGRMGMPDGLARIRQTSNVRIASHGLVHVDHRLLGREAQELSIVTSCSLVGTTVFVPPFNKWNRDTESVCVEHELQLVKFEDGWRHVRFNKFNPECKRYYLHTHDTAAAWLMEWLS